MSMIEKIITQLADKLGAEVIFTAVSLLDRYGESLTVDQYAEVMNIKRKTVQQQISDETVDVKPVKIGRANKFPVIEIAKFMHTA